jgi:hypothetical protein
MRRPIVALLAAAAVVLGLVLLGRFARDRLQRRQYYTVKVADLGCVAPPGMDKATFLAQVQYLGDLPDSIDLLEPGLVNRLQAAFALHPWVERVEGISLRGPAGPMVRLVLRTPVLAVGDRAVDRFGVLLPAATPTTGLLVYPDEAPEPKGPAGTPWGDEKVEAAARRAGGRE